MRSYMAALAHMKRTVTDRNAPHMLGHLVKQEVDGLLLKNACLRLRVRQAVKLPEHLARFVAGKKNPAILSEMALIDGMLTDI